MYIGSEMLLPAMHNFQIKGNLETNQRIKNKDTFSTTIPKLSCQIKLFGSSC